MRPRNVVVIAALVAAPLALIAAPRATAEPAALAAPPQTPSATVVFVATHPGASVSSLYLVPLGAFAAPAPVATFSHLEGATVRASLLPGAEGAVVAVAETAARRDLSFASSLFLLTPHAPPVRLSDRVGHATRPLVDERGRVFVSRGVAGSQPTPSSYREDDLTVDEIDLATGQTRTILAHRGYQLFLAGARGSEIVVYRVGPGGADLVAVDGDSLVERPLGGVEPFARDFSIDDAGGLVFQNRDASDARRWVVDRVDLSSGARTRVFSGATPNMAPHALPGGGVLLNAASRGGFDVVGSSAGGRVRAPLGAGVDAVQARSADGAWLASLHFVPGALPVPFVLEAKTGHSYPVVAPPGARVAIAGIVRGAP